ncbi:MAG: hypothetical protein IJU23_00825, partial [Proteobacteria bacterium]|nr:hypothetical protein [Pseudomonadota bacterium]
MNRRLMVPVALMICAGMMGCSGKKDEPRPSGLKNMAPPPIQESVQEGLDVEPNNTFLQAVDVTLGGDMIQWAGSLEPGDVDVWRIKAKSGTIGDIMITPESQFDVQADFSPAGTEQTRRYFDNGVAGESEVLTNLRLTPQGGYLTVKARSGATEPVKYRVVVSRVLPEREGAVVEAEINDERPEAMQISAGQTIEGVLFPRGDVDYFHLPLTTACTVSIELPDGAHEVAVEQRDKVLWSQVSKNAQLIKTDVLMPEMQSVHIRIKSLEDLKAPHRYVMTVNALEKVPDEVEPNNTIDRAQLLQGDTQNLEFSLLDDADIDIFRIISGADRVHRIRLSGPQTGQAKLQILSADGSARNDVQIVDMTACDVTAQEQGSVWFKVIPGTATWPLNYRIGIDSEDAGRVEREPNHTKDMATLLEPGMSLFGHIFPADDVDIYRIQLPETAKMGHLSIDVEGGYVSTLQLRLEDHDGYEVSMLKSERSRPVRMALDAPGGVYYLTVTGDGDNCLKPYELKVSYEIVEDATPTDAEAVPPVDNPADNAAVPDAPVVPDTANPADPNTANPADPNAANPTAPNAPDTANPALANPAPSPTPQNLESIDLAIEDLIQAAQEKPNTPPPAQPKATEGTEQPVPPK